MTMPLEPGPEMLADIMNRRKEAKAQRGLPEGEISPQDFDALNFGESEVPPIEGALTTAAARRLNENALKGMNPMMGMNQQADMISQMAAGAPPPGQMPGEAEAAMAAEQKFQVQPHAIRPQHGETSRQYGRVMMWLDKAKGVSPGG